MNMQTAPTVNPPVTYNESAPQLPKDDSKVRLEAPRYVFCLGDFIEPGDKRQLRDIGGWTGGMRVGPSQYQGCPTMWRSNYIINTAVFTPLEVVAVGAHDDVDPKLVSGVQIVGNDALGAPIKQREILPGNDIQLLLDESFREQGVVEITSLSDKTFGTGESRELNRKFFPDLDKWLSGAEDFPVLLSDYVTLVSKFLPQTDGEAITQEEMLTSGRVFENYARRQIETTRQAIMRVRNTDMGGYTVGWSPRVRLFAKQLGITLEDDNVYAQREKLTIAGDGNIVDAELKAREVAAQEEANALKREELTLLKAQFEAKVEKKVK